MKKLTSALIAIVLSALVACGTTSRQSANVSPGYGVVENVTVVQQGNNDIGVGTVVGGVVGGALGSQVGGGRGETAATIAGALGGAYVGHQIEKNRKGATIYRLSVRMDDGTYQTAMDDSGAFRVGDRVRVQSDGKLEHR